MSSATRPEPSAPSSSGRSGDPSSEDRTARARIRDAALREFGRRGFSATTLRLIASEAGVSPALVVHHFGSKQGLRDALDQALADQIRDGEFAMMSGSVVLSRDAYVEMAAEYRDALPYLGRALAEGDELGSRLFDRLAADAVEYLEAGVDSGLVRPTDHPKARAATLLAFSLGLLSMGDHLHRVLGVDDELEMLLGIAPVVLDLYTHGLFTDDRTLQLWHDQQRHHARPADPDPPTNAA